MSPGKEVKLPSKKKFKNGWTQEIEKLMAEWADKAVCYRWMHEKTERAFYNKDLSLMFPIIILSTVTGAANFALNSVVKDETLQGYVQLGLGGLSIITGIISTIANRLAYASGSEAHKGAAILWGKFQRLIAIELSLNPDERTECMFFLKMCRTELDRLIERSPTIPDTIIEACKVEFKQYPSVHVPEVVGNIDTTSIYDDKNARLKQLAQEAAITLAQKKGVLKQIVLDDLEPRIARILEYSALPALREDLMKEMQKMGRRMSAPNPVVKPMVPPGAARPEKEQEKEKRVEEVARLAQSGVVAEMKRKLAEASSKTGKAPAGIGIQIVDLAMPLTSPRSIASPQGAENAFPVIKIEDETSDGEKDIYKKL
jgi:hypothetical protein